MSSTATLHFFCGKAGAGKTTVASRLAQDDSVILISEDIWMLRLSGDQMTHHLTEDDFVHISSFFQAPEEAERFNIRIHAA